jgi:Uncharacterized conserved protein
MKIAVPTKEGRVDDHFGHCAYYTIYTVEEKQVVKKETLPSPQGCGCKSNISSVLQQMGVTVMLAGNMGDGARNVLNMHQIQVFRGCAGDTDEVVANYLNGSIADSGITCAAHGEHHVCQHNH